MKRVATFTRVSTGNQHSSVENQGDIFESWLSKNDGYILVKEYVEEAVSGTKAEKRKVWNQMLKDAKAKQYDILLVKSMSRFGRNTRSSLNAIHDIGEAGGNVYFLEDNLRTDEGKGANLIGLYAWVAELESSSTSSRLTSVFNVYKEQGRITNAREPYGYNYNETIKNFEINESESETLKRMYNLYLQGYGYHKISKVLNDERIPTKLNKQWSGNLVLQVLRNEFNTGTLIQNKTQTINITTNKRKHIDEEGWIKHHNHHPEIISYDIYNKYLEEKERRSKIAKQAMFTDNKNSRHSTASLFSNILYCGHCGYAMIMKRTSRKAKNGLYSYYTCSAYETKKKDVIGHSANSIMEEPLVDAIKQYLTDLSLDDFRLLKEKMKVLNKPKDDIDVDKELKRVENEIDKETKKTSSLIELFTEGMLSKDNFKKQNEQIETKLVKLNTEKNKLLSYKNKKVTPQEEKEVINNIEELLSTPVEEWTNQMLKQIFGRIDFIRGKGEPHELEVTLRCENV